MALGNIKLRQIPIGGYTIIGGMDMKLKGIVASMTVGAAAGAAAVLLMPKSSQVYQTMNDAARSLKMEAGKLWETMKQ